MSAQERVMRAMKYAFVVSGFLLIFVMVRIPAKTPRILDPRVQLLIAALALLNLALAFGVRPFLVRMVGRASRGGSTAISRWFTANVFSLACIESCMLFGFVLHLLGGSLRIVELLCGCAMVCFVLWTPGNPNETERANASAT